MFKILLLKFRNATEQFIGQITFNKKKSICLIILGSLNNQITKIMKGNKANYNYEIKRDHLF